MQKDEIKRNRKNSSFILVMFRKSQKIFRESFLCFFMLCKEKFDVK